MVSQFQPDMMGAAVSNPHLRDTTHLSNNQDPCIHILFGQSNFPEKFTYQVFAPTALLATRLLRTQQSYHYLYAILFGKNRRSRVPFALGDKLPPNVPEGYASNKGIGELTTEDIKGVDTHLEILSQRVRFEVGDLPAKARGWTEFGTDPDGQGSRTLIDIWIDQDFYDMVRDNRDPSRSTFLRFCMAMVFIHEVAHAVHMYIMGDRPEDFLENSLVAEAGFEFQTRTLGILPMIHPNDLAETYWAVWETQPNLNPPYY